MFLTRSIRDCDSTPGDRACVRDSREFINRHLVFSSAKFPRWKSSIILRVDGSVEKPEMMENANASELRIEESISCLKIIIRDRRNNGLLRVEEKEIMKVLKVYRVNFIAY